MNNFYAKISSLTNPESKYWEGYFESYAEAEAWKDEQILKPSRNVADEWFREDELTQDQISIAIDLRYVEFEPDVYYKEYLIPAEAEWSIRDITSDIDKRNSKNSKKKIGKVLAELSQNIMRIIKGHLYHANLTEAEYSQLKSDFATTYQALSENRPLVAKGYIDQITPTGVITQDIIDDVYLEYEEYKEQYPSIVIY